MIRASTVSEIVNQFPGAIPVFEKFNIDFCCQGKRHFAEACQRTGVSEEEVFAALTQPAPAFNAILRAQDWSLDLLANYIVQNHHQYTKRVLIELLILTDKVCHKHEAHHPELEEIRNQVQALNKELQAHMYNEEHVLFPAIHALVKESARLFPSPDSIAKSMSNLDPLILTFETEHELAGHSMNRIRSLSTNFSTPPDACTSYVTLYQLLKEFEADLHLHIHLENNLLFPKTLSLQARQQEKPLYVN